MAQKKSAQKNTIPKKTTIIKIAEKVGEIAGRIVNEKDHLVEMAGDAIDSVKTAVKNITSKKEASVKKVAKKAVKKVAGKVSKKTVRPSVKIINKIATPKKVNTVKKAVKKVVKKADKKVSSAKTGK